MLLGTCFDPLRVRRLLAAPGGGGALREGVSAFGSLEVRAVRFGDALITGTAEFVRA